MLRRLLLTVSMLGIALSPMPAHASSGSGVFSIHCPELAKLSNDDPIVYPGQPGAAHLHQFTGNTSTDADSTYDTMVAASTTCRLREDTAGYWTPALVDSQGNAVALRGWNAYYRGDASTVPFPKDIRIIAGYKTRGMVLGTKGLGFSCGPDGPFSATPKIDCGAGYLQAHIVFPHWWDGVRTHDNDTDHVSMKKTRVFNIPLPTLGLHLTFNVHTGTGLMLSSDMDGDRPAGSTLHADFWNTWQQPALKQLVDDCLNAAKDCLDLTSVV